MKILLVGEYSRLHNSLKEGLQSLGHEVTLIGNGDLFKKYPVDINIDSPIASKYAPTIVRKLVFKLFKIDLWDFEKTNKLKKVINLLKGFDVVQLINEDAFSIQPELQKKYISQLKNQNKQLFLLSCGDDYISINHYLNNKNTYSILTPYLINNSLKSNYYYSLKYKTQAYKQLHEFVFSKINGVIASDLDYHIPLKGYKKYLGLIPNPINTEKLEFKPLEIRDKIVVFHGVNSKNYIKKGNQFFDEALEIIKNKYDNKVTVIRTEDLPYNQYIEAFNQAHIVLDQVYAYDQGYNALEAMAKGKVVFTGAEQEWLDYYNLDEDTVAINALPDTNKIAEKLSWLIENSNQILEISKNARTFIELEHNYKKIAERYIKTWEENSI